jgi:hypothetical protein
VKGAVFDVPAAVVTVTCAGPVTLEGGTVAVQVVDDGQLVDAT